MNIREMTLMMGIKGSINDTNSNKNKIDRSTISSKQIKELMKTHHIYMNWKKAHKNPDCFKLPDIDSRKWGFELVADVDVPENELRSAKETSDRILKNIYAYLEKKSKSLSDNDMAAFYPIKKYFDELKENKPAVIKTQKEFNIGKTKYVNKPKELHEGQQVIITSYEGKKNSEVKPQETDKVLMYVPEYVKETDGKTINLDKEMKDKIMEIAKSGVLSILHLKSEEAYVELIKEKIERKILKLTEFHSTGTFAFENDEIQLVFVGNHIGIHLKEAA